MTDRLGPPPELAVQHHLQNRAIPACGVLSDAEPRGAGGARPPADPQLHDDRSRNALWLGTPVPLNLDTLRPTCRPELYPKA